jgi:hypothetical protein
MGRSAWKPRARRANSQRPVEDRRTGSRPCCRSTPEWMSRTTWATVLWRVSPPPAMTPACPRIPNSPGTAGEYRVRPYGMCTRTTREDRSCRGAQEGGVSSPVADPEADRVGVTDAERAGPLVAASSGVEARRHCRDLRCPCCRSDRRCHVHRLGRPWPQCQPRCPQEVRPTASFEYP